MKHTGSAVLTALQAKSKSIEEIEELTFNRRLKANCSPSEWDKTFWHTIAIMEAELIHYNLK